MQVKYVDYSPFGLELSAVHLYLDALRDKLMPIFRDKKRVLNVLAHSRAPVRCLTVLCHHKLAGVLGSQTAQGGFLNPALNSLIGEYGLIGGFHRFAGLPIWRNVFAMRHESYAQMKMYRQMWDMIRSTGSQS